MVMILIKILIILFIFYITILKLLNLLKIILAIQMIYLRSINKYKINILNVFFMKYFYIYLIY